MFIQLKRFRKISCDGWRRRENKQKEIFVRDNPIDELSSQSRKTTLTVGIILLVLLIVSVTFGIKQKIIEILRNKV